MEFSSRAKMLVCVRVWGFLEMAQILYFSDVEFSSRAKILVCVRVCEFLFICLIFKYIWGFIPYGSNSGLSAKAERPEYGQHSLQPPPRGVLQFFMRLLFMPQIIQLGGETFLSHLIRVLKPELLIFVRILNLPFHFCEATPTWYSFFLL